jgi:branched-chain amino acid transport system substrate-binding protein
MRRARALTPIVGLTLVSALALAACGEGGSTASGGGATGSGAQGGQGGTIKIGEINPFSGAQASGGNAVDQGYQLAVDEVNKAGGVNGKQVTLVKGDATTPALGISEVTRLNSSENVDLFAGCYISAVSATASQTAQQYNKLYWDTNSVAKELTERGLSNYVRFGPSATQFGQVSVDAVKSLLQPKLGKGLNELKVFVSHEGSAYGTSIATLQQSGLAALGAQVTHNVAYDAAAADLSSVVVQGAQDNPDVWVETGYVSDISLLLRTAKQQNFRPKAILLVGSGDNAESLKAIGADQLQGITVVAYPHAEMSDTYAPGASAYLKAYQAKFNAEPAFPQTLSSYVGMKQLLAALTAANSTDPAAVRTALKSIDKPAGTFANGFGEKFDANFQNTNALLTVVQWQSGKTVTVYPEAARLPGSALVALQ